MYADNGLGRRRPEGWAERRRYFRKITDPSRRAETESTNPNDTERKPDRA